jgi:uncharacterized protein YbjT (DUF2867 family)
VAVAGATGLIGRALLELLVADHRVAEVHALLRRPPAVPLPTGALPLWIDPKALAGPDAPAMPAIDHAYCALGTTMAQAGSPAAFRAIDLEAVLAFAAAARAAGAQRLGVVSATGADARSSVFYNRIKGEAEVALRAQAWPRLVIARPSLLLGDRAALGQPARGAEQVGQWLMPSLGRLMPQRWRPIEAMQVAMALHRAMNDAATPALQVLENERLRQMGA